MKLRDQELTFGQFLEMLTFHHLISPLGKLLPQIPKQTKPHYRSLRVEIILGVRGERKRVADEPQREV